ncbi:MAG TPA: efflux RND transporter periplasmic adaptor subunit, partial [Methylocella sp.]|nr:efflux RND transporter periplasmic adaptor subunit [Methylocella sp.]
MLQTDEDLQSTISRPFQQPKRLPIAGMILLAIAATSVVTVSISRWRQDEAVKQWTATQAVPFVSFTIPVADGASSALILPGDIQAWFDAPIFARVNGFLKQWYFDYGAHVKAGQILAEI